MTIGRRRKMEYERDGEEEQISDYVKIRLALARMKAMKVYEEKWA
jgi:hypothetical protein